MSNPIYRILSKIIISSLSPYHNSADFLQLFAYQLSGRHCAFSRAGLCGTMVFIILPYRPCHRIYPAIFVSAAVMTILAGVSILTQHREHDIDYFAPSWLFTFSADIYYRPYFNNDDPRNYGAASNGTRSGLP